MLSLQLEMAAQSWVTAWQALDMAGQAESGLASQMCRCAPVFAWSPGMSAHISPEFSQSVSQS